MRGSVIGLAVVAPFVVGLAVTPSPPHGTEVMRFDDHAIIEASDLVVDQGLFATTNDSGDTGRVFVVDRRGRTVGVTHWSDAPTDVEALAPAGPGAVWVGDIGDNLARRPDVAITQVPIGRGDRTVQATTYRLAYPGGARDAETLVRDPRTGRLYLASKDVFGGTLYAVPRHLSATRVNPLTRVGRVLPMATDGAFFPDGRHLVIRGYGSATVYAWPALAPVASFDLPAQPQGEGIAVVGDRTLYLSSEGARSAVLRVTLPRAVRRAMGAASPSPSPSPSSPSATPLQTPQLSVTPEATQGSHDLWPWVLGGLVGLGAVVVLVRSLRPR